MDVMQPTVANPWGRQRPTIEDELRACEDYVRQMRACLDGEKEPTRRFVIERAHYLHLAANQLVRVTQDAERSLSACNAEIEPAQAGRPYSTICLLPDGHTGTHDDHPPLTPAERVREEARHIAQQTDQLTNRLAWLTTDIDRRAARGQDLDPDQRQLLDQLTTKLNAISYNTTRLAKDTTDLAPETARAVAPAAPTNGLGGPASAPPQHQLER
jgi:hypothetical protein